MVNSPISGSELSGATPTYGDGLTATTDTSGIYTFTSLLPGSYTLTPRLEGYTFSPDTMTVQVPVVGQIQDFLAQAPEPDQPKVYLPMLSR